MPDVERMRRVLSMIAYCDTKGHDHYEPTGLYRSQMIRMARNALGDTEPNIDLPPRRSDRIDAIEDLMDEASL